MSAGEQLSLFVSDLPGLQRVLLARAGKLERVWLQGDDEDPLDGIYWARVTKLVAGMQAAFFQLSGEREGFLNRAEIPAALLPTEGAPIEAFLKQGQHRLVQIRRPALDGKQAGLSLNLKLAGYYLIYLPYGTGVSLSKRFEGEEATWRARLAAWGGSEGGWILRSNAAGATEAAVRRECESLRADWTACHGESGGTTGPRWQDPLVGRALLASWREGMKVHFEDRDAWARAKDWCDRRLPQALPQLFAHGGPAPLLETYGLFSQWDELRSERVWLKSGGNLSIRQTEAMVVIDVNTAKGDKGKAGRGLAERVNEEALFEAARQIRLRELAGILAIDLVDAVQAGVRSQLDRVAQRAFGEDEAKLRLLPINEFGVLMLTRERRQLDFNRRFQESCPRCKGLGRVRSRQAQVTALQEQLLREGREGAGGHLVLLCEPGFLAYLQPRQAELLEPLARRFSLKLELQVGNRLEGAWDIQPRDE